jgi:phosphopantothenoylcysteine decarboxylase/phosphopantothenate--cysteine ligase
MSRGNILFGVTGSIAAYKACTVVSRLAQAGVEVQVVATAAALRFVGEPTWEGLSGRPVFSDLWQGGRAMDHIELARHADLAVVCPATAASLNRLSAGLAEDALGTLFLAWELKAKPWWVVPAMNASMWAHPATQASVAKLTSWGVTVIEPDSGAHACGESGSGRLPDPEGIAARLLAALPTR